MTRLEIKINNMARINRQKQTDFSKPHTMLLKRNMLPYEIIILGISPAGLKSQWKPLKITNKNCCTL